MLRLRELLLGLDTVLTEIGFCSSQENNIPLKIKAAREWYVAINQPNMSKTL